MSALFLELARTVPFLFSPLAPHGEVVKTLPGVRLATKKLLVSVDAVVGLELLSKTLADKHMATVLPNCVPCHRHCRGEPYLFRVFVLPH